MRCIRFGASYRWTESDSPSAPGRAATAGSWPGRGRGGTGSWTVWRSCTGGRYVPSETAPSPWVTPKRGSGTFSCRLVVFPRVAGKPAVFLDLFLFPHNVSNLSKEQQRMVGNYGRHGSIRLFQSWFFALSLWFFQVEVRSLEAFRRQKTP